MVLRPRLRKLVLTAHVTTSVGWLGAVIVFLALAVAGLTSGDGQVVRAVYLVMPPLAPSVVVPLAVTALVTGTLSSLGTAPLGSVRDATPTVHAGLALVALVAATTLSTYKPRGVTPLGSRERLRLDRAGRRRLVGQARSHGSGVWSRRMTSPRDV